nr:MAG TPA: hypothetical protein [Herelleviridae sp.]
MYDTMNTAHALRFLVCDHFLMIGRKFFSISSL